MTSAINPSAQTPHHATSASPANSGTTSPHPGAVPAQLPVRSYASATKTASSAIQSPAGASAPNAKSNESPVNGANTIAHGGSQPNGTPAGADHGRKPSVVINASGASGTIPNGGPVSANGGRPHINFGAMNASPLPQHAAPNPAQASSLPAPPSNPRVISPAHSPSPIPQPQASGGRPPSGLQNQTNGMTFGQLGGEGDQVRVVAQDTLTVESQSLTNEQFRQSQGPLGPGGPSMHERRQSSQSMQGDMSNPNMQNMRGPYMQGGPAGRGRGGFPGQPYGGMPSPGMGYRQPSGGPPGPRQSMPPQFQPGGPTPNSPYMRAGSPAVNHARPNMQQYGYPQHSQVRTSVHLFRAHPEHCTTAISSREQIRVCHSATTCALHLTFSRRGETNHDYYTDAVLKFRPIRRLLPAVLRSVSGPASAKSAPSIPKPVQCSTGSDATALQSA
jgi:translation initiation factor 4G